MTVIRSIILGVIQGITEFLPISSSGHLALAHAIFGVGNEDNISFDLLLHLGTLAAVCIVYRRELAALSGAALSLMRRPFTGRMREKLDGDEKFLLLVAVATLPLFAVKLLRLDEAVEKVNSCVPVIGCILLFNGAMLLASDKRSRGERAISDMKWYQALFVGICQSFAALPGLSRSGSTITGGLLCSLERPSAVRFSFIMSLPAILGASALKVPQLFSGAQDISQIPVYLAGAAASAIVGCAAMSLLNKISKKSNFRIFSYYCFAVGAAAIIYGIIK